MNFRNSLLGIALVLAYTSVFCQKIDSLKALLPFTTDTAKVDLLYELAREYNKIDPKSALSPAMEAYEISRTLQDTVRVLRTGIYTGRALRSIGNLDSSIAILQKILPLSSKKKHWEWRSSALNALGVTSIFQARYDDALSYYYDALDIAWKLSDTASITPLLNNIGLVYYKLKDYERALEQFIQCRDLMNVAKITDDLDKCLINIGLCYVNIGQDVKAQEYIENGLELATSELARTSGEYALGLVHFNRGNYAAAESSFQQSLFHAEKAGDFRYQFDNIDYLCQIYLRLNKLEKALKYLKTAEQLMKQGGAFNLELIKIYRRFFELYLMKKDFQHAALYQEKYIQLKDSVYNEELTNNLMKVEAEYLERENRARIASQEEVLGLNERVIRNQRLINLFIGGLAFCLVLLAIVLTRSNRQKKLINSILSDRVRERTKALEVNQEDILRVTLEMNLIVEKMCVDIKGAVATIRGLCSIGLSDTTDLFASQCITKVAQTAERLGDSVETLQRVVQQPHNAEINDHLDQTQTKVRL